MPLSLLFSIAQTLVKHQACAKGWVQDSNALNTVLLAALPHTGIAGLEGNGFPAAPDCSLSTANSAGVCGSAHALQTHTEVEAGSGFP